MTKRNSLAKMGVIMLALVAGLGLLGIGVSYWSDMLNITGTVETGTFETELSCDECSPGTPDTTWISCYVDYPYVVPHVLEVTVEDIEDGVDYHCDFHIYNSGTIPVKVLGQELTEVSDNGSIYTLPTAVPVTACQWYYVDVDEDPPTVREDTGPQLGDDFAFHLSAYQEFQQIDPGDTESGTVHVSLTDSGRVGDDFDFTVAFEVVQWTE